ncbi:hypothetical protein TNCV_2685861 [Trichonephila clavipes]|nr:hypothetical protein TNCV_2685861 [Trichonephila clavipes]
MDTFSNRDARMHDFEYFDGSIRAHYEHLSEYESGRIIGLKEGGWAQIGESLVLWVEAVRPLEDADKNGRTVADFIVMMVAINLGPQQIRSTDRLSDQMSQRLIHCYQPSDARPAHECPP